MDDLEECPVHKHNGLTFSVLERTLFESTQHSTPWILNMNIKMYETKMRSYRNGEEGKDLWECEKGSRVGVVGRGWSWVRKSLQPPPAVKTTPFTWQRRMTWWSRSASRVGRREGGREVHLLSDCTNRWLYHLGRRRREPTYTAVIISIQVLLM